MAEQDTDTQTVETTTEQATTETVERPQAQSPEQIQAELARVQAALKDANNEAASRRKKLEAYEAAEAKRKEAEMTELEKAQAKLAALEAKTKAYEFEKLQSAAASKVGLPAAYADRLRGETPEELEADAKLLLEAMPKKSTPAIPATNPGGATGNMGIPGGKSGMSEADIKAWMNGLAEATPSDGYSLPPRE